jgi:hypothetical protein
MKIIYDTEKPAHERVVIDHEDGNPAVICGAFNIQVETTDIQLGRASVTFTFKRWGAKSVRDGKHKAVKEAILRNKSEYS